MERSPPETGVVTPQSSSPLVGSEESFFLPAISVPSSPKSLMGSDGKDSEDEGSLTEVVTDPGTDAATITPRRQRWKTGVNITSWPIPTTTKKDSSPSLEPSPPSVSGSSSGHNSGENGEGARQPLRPLPQNGKGSPPVALATPFLPGISDGIWAPDWVPPAPPTQQEQDKDAEIRMLNERVQRLTLERDMAQSDNSRLLGEVHQLSGMLAERASPLGASYMSRHPVVHPFGPRLSGENIYQSIGLSLHDPQAPMQPPLGPTATYDAVTGVYRPSSVTVDLILSGKLDYMRLDPRCEHDLIRPLVTKDRRQLTFCATLKIAANALGGRLGQPRSLQSTQYLVSVITEWAKPLCFTSNGNYLCQQLLEKCSVEDKINFIQVIESDIVSIANNKFGAHVLVKAVGVKELEARITGGLIKYGIFESMQTGARKVWRPYLGKCRSLGDNVIFDRIMSEMKGRWADLAVSNENGSISVQQIFEGCANQDLIDACFKEILEDISRVANNQFGHFVVNKLLNFQEPMLKAVSHAILTAYPPLATNHHGVQFVEFVISSSRILQRSHIVKYLESLCSQKDGRTPAIVAVANSSVGRGHLQTVLRQIPPGERMLMNRVHSTCRQFQTTLRNSQSGNELLRSL